MLETQVPFFFNFQGSGYIADIDAFRFIKEAEVYSSQSGTQLVKNGKAVGFIQAGDYIGYENFTFPDEFDMVEINLAVPQAANDPNDRIILTIGDPQGLKLAYLIPNATGGWNSYQKQQFNVGALRAAGYEGSTVDFYLTFEGTGFVVDIDSFHFYKSDQ